MDKPIGFYILPLNEDEEIDKDDLLLRWSVQKQRGSKENKRMEKTGKVTKTYTIRIVEKKLIGDFMKENKFATI